MVETMTLALVLTALFLTGSGAIQTAPAAAPQARAAPAPASAVTRSLNSAPPAAVAVPPSAPASVPSRASPAIAPAATSVRPYAAPATVPTVTTPAWQPAPASTPARVTPPVTAGATPANAPVVAPAAPVESLAPPPPTVLTSAAIAALPFTIELPAGFTITTGRPGPNFNIWTIRRGQQPMVMVYAGPASQFPIYSGEMVEAGARASVVATEEGRRVALEHLFTRPTMPQEIHVWITSVEGADRTLAERIGQSVDAR